MKIQDVMTKDVLTVRPDTPLKEAAAVLARNGVSGVPVVNGDGTVVGVFSEADILVKEEAEDPDKGGLLRWLFEPADPAFESKLEARTVEESMTSPALTIGPDRPLREAAAQMLNFGVNRLPVVDEEGTLLGIVTRADLVRAFTRPDAEVRQEILDDVLRRTLWVDPDAVEVQVDAGVVTLRGQVENEADVKLLETFVNRVPGVVAIVSEVGYRVPAS